MGVVELLNRTDTALAVSAAYAALGLSYVASWSDVPQWYVVILGFFLFKMLCDYHKCTVSYLECKLRGVKKEQGYLNALIEPIVGLRRLPGARLTAALFTSAMYWYYFLVKKQRISATRGER